MLWPCDYHDSPLEDARLRKNILKEKTKTLLDVLKEKVPDLIYDEYTLVIGQEFITSRPQD